MVGPTEEAAVEAIDAWSVKTMCPLSKIRYNKGVEKNGQYIKGRRCYQIFIFKCDYQATKKSG